MSTRILAFVLICIMALSFTGCGKKPKTILICGEPTPTVQNVQRS